jgi:hypothetical protein
MVQTLLFLINYYFLIFNSEFMYLLIVFVLNMNSLNFRMSVRKLVPTLTSTTTEIYLSMACAKQQSDTSFILVPAGAVCPAGVCSRHCIALHRGACRGELQARWERRQGLQVPEV